MTFVLRDIKIYTYIKLQNRYFSPYCIKMKKLQNVRTFLPFNTFTRGFLLATDKHICYDRLETLFWVRFSFWNDFRWKLVSTRLIYERCCVWRCSGWNKKNRFPSGHRSRFQFSNSTIYISTGMDFNIFLTFWKKNLKKYFFFPP